MTPDKIRGELEKAAGWANHQDPRVRDGAAAVFKVVRHLVGMVHMNRRQAVEWQGRRYDSKLELKRHQVLQLREKAGLIEKLEHHPEPVRMVINGAEVGTYRPDFRYLEPVPDAEPGALREVWEDVKGLTRYKTKAGKSEINPAFRAFLFKAKVLTALFPQVDVRVVTKDKISL